tara:strand:- start:6 stop:116 length:111 start_codon:yes stop_codon:yes gene_type:complete
MFGIINSASWKEGLIHFLIVTPFVIAFIIWEIRNQK